MCFALEEKMRCFSKGTVYEFKGKNTLLNKGIWKGKIHKWDKGTAILKLHNPLNENEVFLVPDNLITNAVI